MEWVEITVEGVIERMPTDVKAKYDAWLVSYPDKANRLAEITANTIREFRDNIKSVPKNHWHEDETYLPQSAVRHLDTIIVFTLAMEMGLPIDTAGIGARYAADIFLRQILMGRYTTTTEEGGEGTPRYNAPTRDPAGRALPAFLAVMLAFVQFAAGGWIRPDGAPTYDTEIATTFIPTSYSITTATLFGHLLGINSTLETFATKSFVTNAIAAGVTIAEIDPAFTYWLSRDSTRIGHSLLGANALSVGAEGSIAMGDSASASSFGIAVGQHNSAGMGAAAFGEYSSAGEMGFAYGERVTSGVYGFAGGLDATGGPGSFIFSDSSGGIFDRSLYSNWFSVRASGGTYFETPDFEVSGSLTLGGETRTNWPQGTILGATINEPHTVATNDGILAFTVAPGGNLTATNTPTAGQMLYASDATKTNLYFADAPSGTGWTNLSITGTGNAITGATAAGTTLTLERGTIEGGGSGISAAEAGQIATNVASGYLPLSGYDGLVVLGTRTRGYAASTNLGEYGFAAGANTSAGEFGFAAGVGTSAGYAGFAAGWRTSAGYAGFAAGEGTSAGDYGFAAGRAAKGADGSFVFADNSTVGTPFNRTNRPNEFAARAAGGVYFDTPMMVVTGTVSAGSITLGTNAPITNWPEGGGGGGWTNLAFSGTGNVITNATAAGDTLTLERGTIEGGGGGGTADPFSSILVEADWTWTNGIYAVGADTSSTNIAVTLPDAGTNFASVVIRKFSNLNQLQIVRGTNVVYTLYDDGSTRAFDWWPQRTNWFWRN